MSPQPSSFYASIARVYDQLFPFQPAQREFVLRHSAPQREALLDLGCGSASLLLSLMSYFEKRYGLDPDAAMLALAREKLPDADKHPQLLQSGMLEMERVLGDQCFDHIVCFGNTLVHLESREEVEKVLRMCRQRLVPGGRMMIQIINYARIFDQQLSGLPTIETEDHIFERHYEYSGRPEQIIFHSLLREKATGAVIENRVPLLALQPDTLRELMTSSGFEALSFFGAFTDQPFTPESQPCIAVGEVQDTLKSDQDKRTKATG